MKKESDEGIPLRFKVRIIFSLVLVSIFNIGCTYSLPPIAQKPLAKPNPTTYTFSAPIKKVREQIDALCTQGHNPSRTSFDTPTSRAIGHCGRGTDYPFKNYEAGFRPELDTDDIRLFGEDFSNGLFIPQYYSRLYRYESGTACPVSFDLQLKVEATDTKSTLVTLRVVEMNTISGYYGGMHGSQQKKLQKLAPTTIEEYEILLYIGMRLGESGMPKLQMP